MPTRPNVLWICTDQQRFDTLGCYGNEFVDTPNVDRLAERGVQFDRCFAQSPICTPSRASFLTGRYPRTTRCRANGQQIPADENLITRRLSEAGYTCGLAGKLHLAPCNPDKSEGDPMTEERIDDGYADFHWSHHPGHDVAGNEYVQWLRERGIDVEQYAYTGASTDARRFDRSDEHDDPRVRESEHVEINLPDEHHQTTWCARKAETFIEDNADRDRPWLFSVNVFDPHHPFDPPASHLDRYLDALEEIPLPAYGDGELDDKPPYQANDHRGAYNTEGVYPHAEMSAADHRLVRAAYWAMIDLIDDAVGRTLDALERTGQLEDTIVIFTSDHGEMLGDHGIYLKGPYFYEEAVRVPLIVSWPGRVEEGVRTDALVELTDIAPTLADAAGLDRTPGVQGRSLWPTLTGEADPSEGRESVYAEYYGAMPDHDDFPVRPNGTMVRTDRYKLVDWRGLETGELYDLDEEPRERTNRWDDEAYRDVKVELLDELHDRTVDTVDPLPERTAPW